MTVACIVQARLGSTRLPAKVLLPLPTGRTVLEEVLHRCRLIPGSDYTVLAIPDTPANDILERIALKFEESAGIVRGSEHDVLGRYLKAAHAVGAKTVMRITADCPLIDPEVCGQVLAAFRYHGGAPYASNCTTQRTFPQGFDCEVFTFEALIAAASDATDAYDREHVTPYIWREIARKDGRCLLVKSETDRSHLRWTLDTLEDYVTIWGVFEQQMRDAA